MLYKCLLSLFLFTSLITNTSKSQTIAEDRLSEFDTIRPYDYRFPGNYEVVARLTKKDIYQDDDTELNIFFTGFGMIGNAKLAILFSSPVFSSTSTLLLRDVRQVTPTIAILTEDTVQENEKDNSLIIEIPTAKDSAHEKPSIFWLNKRDTYVIFGEKTTPLTLKLHSKNNIEGGNYEIKLVFTYFNKKEWKSSIQTINFHVNNLLEQNPFWAYSIGIILAFIAIIPLIRDGLVMIRNWFKKSNPKGEEPPSTNIKPYRKK